jgi:hypothetical protein
MICQAFHLPADLSVRAACTFSGSVALNEATPAVQCPEDSPSALPPLTESALASAHSLYHRELALSIPASSPAIPRHHPLPAFENSSSGPSQSTRVFGMPASIQSTANTPSARLQSSFVRHYARKRGAAAFKLSDYLPPPDNPPTRLSRAQTPTLPAAPPSFQGPEKTPEMQEKARLFEDAMLAFQERGYLVHPESPDRAEQLRRCERVFEVFGKHGFPVVRLQAALKWEVRHMEQGRKRVSEEGSEGLEEEEVVGARKEVLEESGDEVGSTDLGIAGRSGQPEANKVGTPDAEMMEAADASDAQPEPAVFRSRNERKELARARTVEGTASVDVGPSRDEPNPDLIAEETLETLSLSSPPSEDPQSRMDSRGIPISGFAAESAGEWEPVSGGDRSGPASPTESSTEAASAVSPEKVGKPEWKRTERKGRKHRAAAGEFEGLPPESPYAGSLKGLVKGVGEGGPFTEFVRGPTQPAHKGGQGPGLTLRQKRLASQIQKALAEIIADDMGLRQSLLEEGGFAVLEVGGRLVLSSQRSHVPRLDRYLVFPKQSGLLTLTGHSHSRSYPAFVPFPSFDLLCVCRLSPTQLFSSRKKQGSAVSAR